MANSNEDKISTLLWNDADWKNNPGVVVPFVDSKVRYWDGRSVISYGLGHFGYDIRLSQDEFYVFQHQPGGIVDPKNFDRNFLRRIDVKENDQGYTFTIPAHSYGLGFSHERFAIPPSCVVLCIGKSTYARCGIIVNVTPLEPAWQGYLTIEISNSSSSDVLVYANEGIAQLFLFEGNVPDEVYGDGKYQNQGKRVITAKA